MNVIRKLWQTKKEPWFLGTIKDYGGNNRNVIWTPNLDEAMKFPTLNKAIKFFNMAQDLTDGQLDGCDIKDERWAFQRS